MHSSSHPRRIHATQAEPTSTGRSRHRFCLISPSRSLGYSIQFICKVYCVPLVIYESAELMHTGGIQRALENCTALMVDLQGDAGERHYLFLRELLRTGWLQGREVFALTPTLQRLKLPGVREVRLTTASFQLNVGEFDAIIARWKHPDARPQILPAYRELLRRGAREVELRIDGQHHFWQKLAVLDADPLFGAVIRHLCLRLGFTFVPYHSPRALARDIASGVQFAHVIIDQAHDGRGADEIDPSLLLSAAAELKARPGRGGGDSPSTAAVAARIYVAPEILAHRINQQSFWSVHDQITRILPSIPGVKEIDRMYPSNPLLVNISDLALRLDPAARISATETVARFEAGNRPTDAGFDSPPVVDRLSA